jgi:sirohydrochlorin ferrochelatase
MIASAASKGMTAISADTLFATGTTRICLVLVFNQLFMHQGGHVFVDIPDQILVEIC